MDTEEKKQWYALKDKAAKELKALVDDHDMKAFDGTHVWKLLFPDFVIVSPKSPRQRV